VGQRWGRECVEDAIVHLCQICTIAAAFAEPVADRAWSWFHRRLQKITETEEQRFLRAHPNARVR
jgi:hypothetical protein